MMYRDYKNFDQDIFSQELCTSLSSETVLHYTSFEENFLGVLNKHAPLTLFRVGFFGAAHGWGSLFGPPP